MLNSMEKYLHMDKNKLKEFYELYYKVSKDGNSAIKTFQKRNIQTSNINQIRERK